MSAGHVALFTGCIVLFTGHVALFTGCIALFTGHVALFTGHIALFTNHIAGLLVWLTYFILLCISVHADEDLEKYVLETLKLCCTMFKLKCPADTEDEALVGISSEDEAEDMDLDPAITRRAVR